MDAEGYVAIVGLLTISGVFYISQVYCNRILRDCEKIQGDCHKLQEGLRPYCGLEREVN